MAIDLPAGNTRRRRSRPVWFALFPAALCTLAASFVISAKTPAASIPEAAVSKTGVIRAREVVVPPSEFASAEANTMLARMASSPVPPTSIDIATLRKIFAQNDGHVAAMMRQIYPVDVVEQRIAGVSCDVIRPRQGAAPMNATRVLINLHGGGFMWGDIGTGEVESIPIASVGKIEVISPKYRLAPEHPYPAAVEDVAAVYRELLKRYHPWNIGIYGCSAGGILTAESVAWFLTHHLPVPGAIGTFCGSAAPLGGDSSHLQLPLTGRELWRYFPMANPSLSPDELIWSLPYFSKANRHDPLVFPISAPDLLRKFPPTLLISGSRDFMLSSMFETQRELTRYGVTADLHVWDGVGHAFFMNPQLPESREVYAVVANFFAKHLGRHRADTGQ